MENTKMAIRPSAATSRRQSHAETGFGLIELLMATVVIAFVLVGFAMIFGTASRESVKSANKTDAQQLATARMEKVRLLDYAQIGTLSGNPPGIIPAIEFVGDYTVVTKVTYVDDPAAGGYNTYRDYKKVKITVIVTQSGKTIAVEETKIAPPTGPLTDKGVLKVTVLEAGPNSVLSGVTVTLTGAPGGTRTDETDQNGQVVFADLAPNPSPADQYVIAAEKGGYIVDPVDVAPMPNALVRIAATAVVERVIHLSKPLGVKVTLRNASGGTLFTAPTPVQIATQDGLTWGQQTVSGGMYSGASFGTLPVIAGDSYIFSANVKIGTTFYFGKSVSYTAPVNGTNASALNVPPIVMTPYPNATTVGKVSISVVRNGLPVSGAIVRLLGGPVPIFAVASTPLTGTVVFDAPIGSGYTVQVTDPKSGNSGATTYSTSINTLTAVPIVL
jgi:type II secretory pathway pseudopilin PulG